MLLMQRDSAFRVAGQAQLATQTDGRRRRGGRWKGPFLAPRVLLATSGGLGVESGHGEVSTDTDSFRGRCC